MFLLRLLCSPTKASVPLFDACQRLRKQHMSRKLKLYQKAALLTALSSPRWALCTVRCTKPHRSNGKYLQNICMKCGWVTQPSNLSVTVKDDKDKSGRKSILDFSFLLQSTNCRLSFHLVCGCGVVFLEKCFLFYCMSTKSQRLHYCTTWH